jgi:hypothetical protein
MVAIADPSYRDTSAARGLVAVRTSGDPRIHTSSSALAWIQ